MMLLVLLQNAWSRWHTRIGRPGEEIHRLKDRVWHREDWLAATWASPTGVKLTKILAGIPDEDIWLDDTTLEVADKPSGVKPPDLVHIRDVLLRDQSINAVLACGKQAGDAIDQVWRGPLVKIPHPACRVISYKTCDAYNTVVKHLLAFAARGHNYRNEVTSRREVIALHGQGVNHGGAWLYPSFAEQAEDEPRGSVGPDPAVLQGLQPA